MKRLCESQCCGNEDANSYVFEEATRPESIEMQFILMSYNSKISNFPPKSFYVPHIGNYIRNLGRNVICWLLCKASSAEREVDL